MMVDCKFATCADKERVMKIDYQMTEKLVEKGEQCA